MHGLKWVKEDYHNFLGYTKHFNLVTQTDVSQQPCIVVCAGYLLDFNCVLEMLSFKNILFLSYCY